jgi:hypothetical protein
MNHHKRYMVLEANMAHLLQHNDVIVAQKKWYSETKFRKMMKKRENEKIEFFVFFSDWENGHFL